MDSFSFHLKAPFSMSIACMFYAILENIFIFFWKFLWFLNFFQDLTKI